MDSTEQGNTVIIDLEAELVKEREITENRMLELHRALAEEIEKMKSNFKNQIQNAIEQSEKRMTTVIQKHIGDILQTSDTAITRIEHKANKVAKRLLTMMQDKNSVGIGSHTTSPLRKQPRRHDEDAEMSDGAIQTVTQYTPASHESPTQNGTAKSAGEQT
jgi:hypothetical protein